MIKPHETYFTIHLLHWVYFPLYRLIVFVFLLPSKATIFSHFFFTDKHAIQTSEIFQLLEIAQKILISDQTLE